MAKKTKYLRARIDFSIELKEPTDNAAMVSVKSLHVLAHEKLLEALRLADTNGRALGTAPGFSTSVALDMRKRDADGRVIR